jgi:hypothetical protein
MVSPGVHERIGGEMEGTVAPLMQMVADSGRSTLFLPTSIQKEKVMLR